MKKYSFILLSLFLLSLSTNLYAQRKNPAKNADLAFGRKQYTEAVDRYKKAYKRSKRNKDERYRISYQIGECYRLIGLPKRAEPYYKRVLKSELPKSKPEVYLNLADTYKMNQKYKEAIEAYQIYSKLVPDDPRGIIGAETAAQIKEWIENPSKYEVTELKKINEKSSDFGATWINNNYNEIIFTSNRDEATGKEKDGITGQKFTDFFTSKQDRKGDWSKPVLADENDDVNTKASEGTPFMNSKFTKMYFTRCQNNDMGKSGCQIMIASKTGGAFIGAQPVTIKGIDTLDIVGHPTLSEDELIMYFAAERKGGFGGKDIWVTTRESKTGDFERPMNIGPIVNTAGNELFPFLRNDSTLYFSSDGHGGMGGLDIFVTTIDSAGNWGQPKNLKSPMNSTGDDFAVMFHPKEEKGFFSSNRNNSRGVDNIYYFEEPPVLFTLSGTIKDEKTLQFVDNAIVRLVGSNGSTMSTRTNDKGFFMFGENQISKNTTYQITVDKENYFTFNATETTVGLEFSRDFVKDFSIEPIPQEPIMLPDILYELGKWDLQPQYEDSLQGLIETLQINPTITIELASHTDARDTEEKNDILSQRRAQSVVDYLILRGIDPMRLTAKGYGERNPRTLNKDYVVKGYKFAAGTVLNENYINSLPNNELKEVAHQMNRRTEFRILSKDFVPRTTINENQRINIAINPEDNSIAFGQNKAGFFTFKAFVDGYGEEFTFSRTAEFCVSETKALSLLKDGIINKDDFKGNVEELLGTGTIANNAVFKIKEIRIADKTLQNVDVKVLQRMQEDWVIGQKTMMKFGNFEFNTQTKKLIFK
jgi:Outer membrane protein and related peptidoglycan-associated (lipo)proteins